MKKFEKNLPLVYVLTPNGERVKKPEPEPHADETIERNFHRKLKKRKTHRMSFDEIYAELNRKFKGE